MVLRCDMRLIFLLVHVKWNRERDSPSHRSAELSCRQTLLSLQPEVAAFLMQLTFFCMVCHLCLTSLKCIAEYFPLQGTNGSLFLTFKYTRRGDFFSPCCNCNSHLWRIRQQSWALCKPFSRLLDPWSPQIHYRLEAGPPLNPLRLLTLVLRREFKNIPLSRKGEVLFECQAETSEEVGIFLFKLVPFLLHFATLFSKFNFPWSGEVSLVLKRVPLPLQ